MSHRVEIGISQQILGVDNISEILTCIPDAFLVSCAGCGNLICSSLQPNFSDVLPLASGLRHRSPVLVARIARAAFVELMGLKARETSIFASQVRCLSSISILAGADGNITQS